MIKLAAFPHSSKAHNLIDKFRRRNHHITPAVKCLNIVIAVKAGIQVGPGWRIRHPGVDPVPASEG